MQPRRPQVHSAPSISTTTWPISPAPPRPSHGFPSRISPPPTPVPQKTPSSDRYMRPAPSSNSAWVATRTSLPSATRQPNSRSSSGPSAKDPSHPGRLRAPVTSLPRTVPGEPTPTPSSAAGSVSAALAASSSAVTISRATSGGPPVVGVGRRAEPRTLLSSSTIAAWILVPPRSMPPKLAMAGWAASALGSGRGSRRSWAWSAPSGTEAPGCAPSALPTARCSARR